MTTSRRARRRWIAGGILAAGWVVAATVYLTAAPVEDDPDVYDLEHSRTYVRQLEVIGGKAAVMGKEIDDWIAGLWRGRGRAYTLAAGAAIVALLAAWAWDGSERTEEDSPDR